MQQEYAFSQRRACSLMTVAVSSYRDQTRRSDEPPRSKLVELAREKPADARGSGRPRRIVGSIRVWDSDAREENNEIHTGSIFQIGMIAAMRCA
jgi:hypothetical protein